MGKFSDRFLRVVDGICSANLDYSREAYCFVYEALGFAVRTLDLDPDQHLSGEELMRVGIIPLAFNRWGFLAKNVLAYWNIFCSEDVGKIVRNFVEAGVFNKDSTDRWEDFSAVNLGKELERLQKSNF